MYWICLSTCLGRCLAPGASRVPAKVSSPVQFWCSPVMQRASVVLPDPDSPTMATHACGGTSRLTLVSTGPPP
jgi:hypothetical protein